MMRHLKGIALLALSIFAVNAEENWPQFRGPGGLGISNSSNSPTLFSQSTNLIWKTQLPRGNSSPVIWGSRIFLTAFDGSKLETICIDRASGKVNWRSVAQAPKVEPTHKIGSPATATAATDGQSVFVYFGSIGLLAYDMSGKEIWRKPLPTPVVEFGASSSPILAGHRLILNCDQDLGSFLIAVNKTNGSTLWKTERPEFRRSFASPFHWRNKHREEIVVAGSLWLKGYDLEGKELWTYSGTSRVACSSPIGSEDMLFSASWNIGGDEDSRISLPSYGEVVTEYDKDKDGSFVLPELPPGPIRDRFTQMDLDKNGFVTPAEWEGMRDMFAKAGNAVLAVKPSGKGDVTKSHLAWKSTRSIPYVSSPLYYRGILYTMKNGGLISAYKADTGEIHFQDERVGAGGDYYASPVASGERIYFISQKGVVTVIEAGPKLKILATNNLTEEVFASPAIVEDTIYIRSTENLYAFRKSK